jgi:erythromycin esterase
MDEDLQALAGPLRDAADLDPLMDRIGDARHVLIGEASHGTSEFYTWRAALTRRLVREKGFSFVAVEGDWPDCYEVHRTLTGAAGAHEDPQSALCAYDRWPTWMWANEEVLEFARWLRDENLGRPAERRVGFYGLDVYSLWESLRAILDYLGEHEPQYVDTALQALRCFEPYAEEGADYARATRLVPTSCEDAVVDLLCQLRQVPEDAPGPHREGRFAARQNAEVAAGAERYYRAMVAGGDRSWNVRDHHMVDTLDRLLGHHGDQAKSVVWEHNTHVGDARATDMADAGLVNVGQLVRERHGADGVVLVGFGSHRGSVVAGSHWGSPVEVMPVPAAREGSLEDLLNKALPDPSLLVFPEPAEQAEWLRERRDHRAVGVVYDPDRERWGNYVPTRLGQRYDAFLWIPQTTALRPLHPLPGR